MSLYRHYKNLPYRFIKTVKHSETLEDLVLYETLYENSSARFWVRPKDMFFESVLFEGKYRPRFEKVELEIKVFHSMSDEAKEAINRVGRLAFETWDESQLDARTAGKTKLLALVGYFDGKAVAFKIGYETSTSNFYSWLGGVDPAYHRYGFAYQLSEKQHAWIREQGFLTLQTKCLNFNQAMLGLNLKLGFLVVGTEPTEQGLKLLLEKRIGESLA